MCVNVVGSIHIQITRTCFFRFLVVIFKLLVCIVWKLLRMIKTQKMTGRYDTEG